MNSEGNIHINNNIVCDSDKTSSFIGPRNRVGGIYLFLLKRDTIFFSCKENEEESRESLAVSALKWTRCHAIFNEFKKKVYLFQSNLNKF